MPCSHKPGKEVRAHFPNIAAQCAAYGLDITRDPIPVAPAQHYMCGGVQVRDPCGIPWLSCVLYWLCCAPQSTTLCSLPHYGLDLSDECQLCLVLHLVHII